MNNLEKIIKIIIIMDRRIKDINLGAKVIVGILTIYVAWNVFKGYNSSKTILE